jgi:hypothetical protein
MSSRVKEARGWSWKEKRSNRSVGSDFMRAHRVSLSVMDLEQVWRWLGEAADVRSSKDGGKQNRRTAENVTFEDDATQD